MLIRITRWLDGTVLHELEATDLRATVVQLTSTGANLTGADLTIVRDDLWAVLSAAPAEVPALLTALHDGKVDGSTYSGDCACLVGTIANARGCGYDALGPALKPNGSRPAERFFLGINPGDTPENNQAAKLAYEWASEWYDRMQAAFTPSSGESAA